MSALLLLVLLLAPPQEPAAAAPSLKFVDIEEGDPGCPFDVVATGFPAINTDGSEIVTVRLHASGASEGEDARLVLHWLDARTGASRRTSTLYDMAGLGCERERERARKRTAKLGRSLAAGWRTLHELDVHRTDPDADPYDTLVIPEHQRPVQAMWKDGTLTIGVAGAKPLLEAKAPWWGSYDGLPECDTDPLLEAFYGDATTGRLVVEYSNAVEPYADHCSTPTEIAVVEAPDTLFESLAKQPK